jgi:molybdenum cofactor synthesis domain-containing protein
VSVTACAIVIGNEVLSGRTRDANIAYLGARLNDLGIRLMEVRVIPDDAAIIADTVNGCRAAFDYVFTTGGIGPTHDDITSACIARAFGVELERNPVALALLEQHYRPEDVTEARLTMADIPVGARLIDNPVSKAPGFQMENVFVMAGVPRIMQAMFEGIKDRLAGGSPMLSRTLASFIPEGLMGTRLGEIQEAHPEVEIGSYPFFRDGRPGTSLVVRGADPARIEAAAGDVRALIRSFGGEPVEDAEIDGDG